MVHGEHLAGAGKAGLHFVGDQQDAVFVTDGAQRGQEAVRGDIKAAFALHRLDDDGRHALGVDVTLENLFQALERFFFAHAVHRVRVGGVEHFAREGAKAQFVRGHFAGQAQGHIGATVVAAKEGDHARTAGVAARHFDGVFHGFGASGEERGFLGVVARGDGVEFFRHRHIQLVGHNLIAGVAEFLGLGGHGGGHFVVQVAGVQHANAAGKVDVAATFDVPEFSVFGAVDVKTAHHADPARGCGFFALLQAGVGGGAHCMGSPVRRRRRPVCWVKTS